MMNKYAFSCDKGDVLGIFEHRFKSDDLEAILNSFTSFLHAAGYNDVQGLVAKYYADDQDPEAE